MKGYTIQNSIELLEKKAGSGSGGASTAAQVSYDNTSSHMTADDVQEAIDELNTAIGQINTGIHYSTTESIIGKVGDEDLYGIMVDCEAMPNNTAKNVAHGITDIDFIYNIRGMMNNPTNGLFIPIPGTTSAAASAPHITLWADDTNITIATNSDYSAYTNTKVWLEYTKTAPVANTRSKKSK